MTFLLYLIITWAFVVKKKKKKTAVKRSLQLLLFSQLVVLPLGGAKDEVAVVERRYYPYVGSYYRVITLTLFSCF